jgi:ATP-dependent protease Clp ATPase subunit
MLPKRQREEVLRCSFCDKAQDQVAALISNPAHQSRHVFICNECVVVCNSVLEQHRKAKASTVEARLKASVLEEHRRTNADTLTARLKAFAGRV